jgi:hypothetical protein
MKEQIAKILAANPDVNVSSAAKELKNLMDAEPEQ